jgi:hypothetical protein
MILRSMVQPQTIVAVSPSGALVCLAGIRNSDLRAPERKLFDMSFDPS